MIVTIIQSCIYIKHEVCRTVRPEIGSRCFFQFSIVTFILVAMVLVKDIRIYKNINEPISFPCGQAGTKGRKQIESECFTCKFDK